MALQYLYTCRLLVASCWLVVASPAFAACPPVGSQMLLAGNILIEKRWHELGCAEHIGPPLAAPRRHLGSGGQVQDFEHGQIAVHPRWRGQATGPSANLVLSAHRNRGQIHVRWDGVAPGTHDFFLVRWDRDDHATAMEAQHDVGGWLGFDRRDPQQIEVDGEGSHGAVTIPAEEESTFIIAMKACKDGGIFGKDSCPTGWSYPVLVDNFGRLPAPAQLPLPPGLPNSGSPPLDLADGPMLDPASVRPLIERECRDPGDMVETDEDHEGELKTSKAVAVMLAIFDPSIQCRDSQTVVPAKELRKLLNKNIKKSRVVSVPGTDVALLTRIAVGFAAGGLAGGLLGAIAGFLTGPIGPVAGALLGGALGAFIGGLAHADPGDYDMRMVDLLRIAYRADAAWMPNSTSPLLDPGPREHLVQQLLTVSGGPEHRREHLWIGALPTFIPESENHILMTETSRYLTNQLRARDLMATQQAVPKDLDNDANGMTDWLLEHLQGFVRQGFYETNARPYAREAMEGLTNLYDFAGAEPGGCWRSNPPAATQPAPPRGCDVRRAARIVMDYEAARFATGSLGLRRSAPYRRQPLQRDYAWLLGRQSDSMSWRYLVLAGGGDVFWKERHGRLLPDFSGDLLTPLQSSYRLPQPIADLMLDKNHAWFQRFFYERDGYLGVEIHARQPSFMISAGGMHDQGRLGFIADDEDAWAMPTTLIPRRAGVDRTEFVRITGAKNEERRVNTCVAPDFACGLNPELPEGIPPACLIRRGHWTFVDFAKRSPGCDVDHGYFVVFYRQACDDDACRSAAGGGGTFGFFAVVPPRDTLAELADIVWNANQAWVYRSGMANVFRRPDLQQITFQPMTADPLTWGIVATQQGGVVTQHDGRIRQWPLAAGEALSSDGHRGCVVVDNVLLDQRLVLDFTQAMQPRRTRLQRSTANRLCTCPLPASCLPARLE